jgi:NADH:ubiquinone oxidoreductase subunit 3 (subunit A)
MFVFIYVLISFLWLVSFRLNRTKLDVEKVTPYECGFSPFNDARIKFDVKFYLVSLLFILFDLEVAFLLPWALIISFESYIIIFAFDFFILILTLGFIIEWCLGGLDW